jgi:hypothetical protein
MEYEFLDLERARYTFEALDGEVRGFPGLTLDGKREFDRRIAEMAQVLLELPDRDTASAEAAYRSSARFRWLVRRCLLLNGIDPLWVNWEIAEQLLFSPGYLIRLSVPKEPAAGDTPATYAEIVAAIAHRSSIPEAFELARTEPYQELLEVAEAYAKQANQAAGGEIEPTDDKAYADWRSKALEKLQADWQSE